MKKIFLICFMGIVLLQGCGRNRIVGEPDIVSSISMNQDYYLTVVANCDVIENKYEFAWKLIRMCRENSFNTIKFSTDQGFATRIQMNVYLWQDEIKGNERVMEIIYEPEEENMNYNIVSNYDKFNLYVDGELVGEGI